MKQTSGYLAAGLLLACGVVIWLLAFRSSNDRVAAPAMNPETPRPPQQAADEPPAQPDAPRSAADTAEEAAEAAGAQAVSTAESDARQEMMERLGAMSVSDIGTHRLDVLRSLAPFGDRADALKQALSAEYAPITAEKVPLLLEKAQKLTELFWRQGDFEAPASFESLYRARAAVEMCLAVAPDDESALRAYCEVIMAGWPACSSDDPLALAGLKDLYVPMSTLWEKHISAKRTASAQDLLVAADLLTYALAVPEDVASRFAADVRKQDPAASDADVKTAFKQWRKDRQLAIAQWALSACQAHAGDEWKPYEKYFTDSLDSIRQYGFSMVTDSPVRRKGGLRPGELLALTNRYSLGRGHSFRGPDSNAMIRQLPPD